MQKSKSKPANKSTRILTSVESRAFLEEKLQKKEEEEEKARKKREKEEKQLTKEKEKKRKVEKREAKKAEREAKKAEQENKGKTKAAMKPSAFRGLHGKRKLPGEFSGVVKTYPKRQRVDKTVRKKTSQDTCCVCLGLYRDDIDEETWNVLPEMILMKKLGMFYQNTIGFVAVRMTVVPGAMSNVWRIQL